MNSSRFIRLGGFITVCIVAAFCLAGVPAAKAGCSQAPPGLVAWWRAEGNANDSIDGGNGTPYGGVTFAPGRVGTAFSFDGVNGAINVPDVPGLALTNSLTIEGWIFVTNAPSGVGMILFRGDTRSGLDPYSLDVRPQAGTSGILVFAATDQSNNGIDIASLM